MLQYINNLLSIGNIGDDAHGRTAGGTGQGFCFEERQEDRGGALLIMGVLGFFW